MYQLFVLQRRRSYCFEAEVYTNCPATVSLPSLRSVTSNLSNLNSVAKNVIKGDLLLIEFRHLPIPTIY